MINRKDYEDQDDSLFYEEEYGHEDDHALMMEAKTPGTVLKHIDWTIKGNGEFSTSIRFQVLATKIASRIRENAGGLMNGDVAIVATRILSELAHKDGLVPQEVVDEMVRQAESRVRAEVKLQSEASVTLTDLVGGNGSSETMFDYDDREFDVAAESLGRVRQSEAESDCSTCPGDQGCCDPDEDEDDTEWGLTSDTIVAKTKYDLKDTLSFPHDSLASFTKLFTDNEDLVALDTDGNFWVLNTTDKLWAPLTDRRLHDEFGL
jgi:hypothetical protein